MPSAIHWSHSPTQVSAPRFNLYKQDSRQDSPFVCNDLAVHFVGSCILHGHWRANTLDWNLTMAAAVTTDAKFADILAICQRINSERDLGALLDLIARE